MSPSRRRGRRVPPKPGARPFPPLPSAAGPAADPSVLPPGESVRSATRSQNRAAKRATSGVQAKRVRGSVSGRRGYNPAVLGLAIAAVVVGAAVFIIGNPFGGPAASPSPSQSAEASAVTYGDGSCPTSQPASLAAGEVRTVTIQTDKGTIVMQIDGSSAPIATGNFIVLVACHFYDGLTFHRLVPGFVIQGGDPAGDGSGGPGYSIADDPLNGTYKRGTIAMARTSQPNSQGSQFFIILSDDAKASLTDPQLAPYAYAILGEVTSGMDVVDAIAAMPNSGSQSGNKAIDPVVMTSVTVGPGAPPSASPAASVPGTSPEAPQP